MQIITGIFLSAWQVLLDASIFIIFGLLFAAVIRAFISTETIIKYMGKNNFRSVFLAAIFGVPLPLCSCGVLPTAMGLRKQGASKAATVSFLITTPESSIDSIAITYALIDPIMTIFRPIAAFFTGLLAGICEIMFGKPEIEKKIAGIECPHCHCDNEHKAEDDHKNHKISSKHHHSLQEKLKQGLKFAFIELFSDISRWFLIGMFIAGIINYALPPSFIEKYLGEGLLSMVIMLAIGLPLYTCATASTPIAAALLLKGASPGVALVFLLAGPGTSIASMTVIAKMLGKRTAAIYFLSIATCAIMFGLTLNWLYQFLDINISANVGHAHEMIPVWLKWATAVPLTLFMLINAVKRKTS